LVALVSKNTAFKGEAVPFVLELPNYRMPGAKNVAHLLWDKAKDFIQRAFSVILLATIAIWFLQTFDFRMNIVEDASASILATISGIVAPVFEPLGLNDWRVVTALVAGFMAKESVVSSLTIMYGTNAILLASMTTASAAALLVFCLLYTPCVAAVASIKRELGSRWAYMVVFGQCALAWMAALITYGIGLLI
jgi:ferrous iron transport protein B